MNNVEPYMLKTHVLHTADQWLKCRQNGLLGIGW